MLLQSGFLNEGLTFHFPPQSKGCDFNVARLSASLHSASREQQWLTLLY